MHICWIYLFKTTLGGQQSANNFSKDMYVGWQISKCAWVRRPQGSKKLTIELVLESFSVCVCVRFMLRNQP